MVFKTVLYFILHHFMPKLTQYKVIYSDDSYSDETAFFPCLRLPLGFSSDCSSSYDELNSALAKANKKKTKKKYVQNFILRWICFVLCFGY